jgi:hypothetical protein
MLIRLDKYRRSRSNGAMLNCLKGRNGMKFLFSVLALTIGTLTFQSCEVYPNGTSRGYNQGGYYAGDHYGDGYYGGGGVVVSSGDRQYDHGYGYNNRYYSGENAHVNRNVNGNQNVHANRNAHVNRNVHVSRNVSGNRNADVRHQ